MELHAGQYIDAFRSGHVIDLFADGTSRRGGRDPELATKIAVAHKFIFDGGYASHKADGNVVLDLRTLAAVNSTAEEMRVAGTLRLPFPTTWLEMSVGDPPEHRGFLLEEFEGGWRGVYCVLDAFQPGWVNRLRTHSRSPRTLIRQWAPSYGWMVRHFLVTMAAGGVEREVVPRETGGKWSPRASGRSYHHTVIRIPIERGTSESASAPGNGAGRRYHLVRGYCWGRHTRPVSEQRWIAPFYRGDKSVGVTQRTHYRVTATPTQD